MQICDDKWSMMETRVVCRQLGYSDKETIRYYFHHRQNGEKIWRLNIECKGNEKNIKACSFRNVENSECTKIVLVECVGKGGHPN